MCVKRSSRWPCPSRPIEMRFVGTTSRMSGSSAGTRVAASEVAPASAASATSSTSVPAIRRTMTASITSVPLYVTEAEVAELLSPAEAVEAVEACFRADGGGLVENRPRYRLGLQGGALAVMAAADLELGYAGAKVYAGFRDGARFVVLLFRADSPELVAVIEADKLGQLRTGAASGVAAKYLARSGCAQPRADRLRLAGRVAARGDSCCAPRDRARRRVLPERGATRRVLQRRTARSRARAIATRASATLS